MWNYVSIRTFNRKLIDFEATEPEDKNTDLILCFILLLVLF